MCLHIILPPRCCNTGRTGGRARRAGAYIIIMYHFGACRAGERSRVEIITVESLVGGQEQTVVRRCRKQVSIVVESESVYIIICNVLDYPVHHAHVCLGSEECRGRNHLVSLGAEHLVHDIHHAVVGNAHIVATVCLGLEVANGDAHHVFCVVDDRRELAGH